MRDVADLSDFPDPIMFLRWIFCIMLSVFDGQTLGNVVKFDNGLLGRFVDE